MEASGAFGVVLIISAIIIGILWLILPFAIFGIKDRLDTQIRLLKDIKASLNGDDGEDRTEDKIEEQRNDD